MCPLLACWEGSGAVNCHKLVPMDPSKIDEKTYNGNKVIGVVLRSKAKTVHFLRHAEGLEQQNGPLHTCVYHLWSCVMCHS